ncbi:MAG: hypothetical protein AAB929_04945 [Patescibacteria group bacterium]
MDNKVSWTDTFRKTAYSWLLGEYPPHKFPPVAIIPFENPDMYDAASSLSLLSEVKKANSFVFGKYQGVSIALSNPKFGAPAVAMTLDVLSLTRVKTIIGVGFCGRLHKNIKCGDLIIPTSSFIDEGTSSQYEKNLSSSHSNPKLVEHIQKTCVHLSIPHHLGPIFSTDGILREDEAKLENFVQKGARAVDMESSVAFTVGNYFNRQVASILVGSDNPLEKENAIYEKLQKGYSQAIQVALEVARTSK